MRTMYDSVNAGAIPRDAEMVAGYVDGKFAWSQADWDRFPNAVKVTISAVGTRLAHVVDVEQGCVWPVENAVPWVQWARANGIDPTVYCNWQNDLHRVRLAFDQAGVEQPHYWVAKYDGRREIPAGTVGKQYMAPESGAPGHYDVSSIANYWPGVDSAQTEVDDLSGEGPNIVAFLATGGPSTQVNNVDELIAQSVDPTSVFGRLADVQWALTDKLPLIPQINDRLNVVARALQDEANKNEAFRVEVRAALTAAPAGGALDVERVARRVVELLAERVAE